jgi:hypothetical protein
VACSVCGRSLSAKAAPAFVRRPFSSARLRAALTLLPTARSGGATPGAPASPLGQVVRSKGFVWSDRFPRTALLWHARAPWRPPAAAARGCPFRATRVISVNHGEGVPRDHAGLSFSLREFGMCAPPPVLNGHVSSQPPY